MLKGASLNRFGWVGLLLGFSLTIVALLGWRFEQGDFYPASSTFRADGEGAKAVFESLERIPGIKVSRRLRKIETDQEPERTTRFCLGVTEQAMRDGNIVDLEEMNRFVHRGGRLILAFQDDERRHAAEREEKASSNPRAKSDSLKTFPERLNLWGARFSRPNIVAITNLKNPSFFDADLPETIPGRARTAWAIFDSEWDRVYLRGDHPTVVERRLGRGSVVLLTDSYPMSNDALTRAADARLASWLIGPNRTIVFDETQLGVVANEGIMALIWRYQMGAFLFALVAIAALFVWKIAMPFGSTSEIIEPTGAIQGQNSSAGLLNLIRRSIPRATLIEVCVSEWKRTGTRGHSRRRTDELEKAVQSIAAADKDPIATYQEICKAMKTPTP